MPLAQYFRAPRTIQALDRYARFAGGEKNWGIGNKLRLYNLAKEAFASDAPEARKREAFGEVFEDMKRYWGLFRGVTWDSCWTGDQTFDALLGQCAPCSRQSGLTLATLTAMEETALLSCVRSLRNLKPNKAFPWMPVSKVLHFYNPGLFPIYDGEVLWKQVCDGAFRRDYREFCREQGYHPTENSAAFNVNYTRWAGAMIQQADGEFMPTFEKWFRSVTDGFPDPQGVLGDLDRYYAVAFEFVAIGAAHL